ncbi:MAG: AsnC family transcriptional regulator [Methanoculleus sp. SDB]|jgi:Lrp/AsnC family leucine-responsive transcriptional regulator|nr:MAG: AsnC family transcriptional regulator [Methanoculleus sp. SDB]
MDEVDTIILSELQHDARISMAELGKKLNIAPSTVFKRIEKLKKSGVIEGFTIAINTDYLEEHLIAFLTIKVDPDEKDAISQFLTEQECILEVYETLEPADFIAKVRVGTITQLKKEVLIPLSKFDGMKEIRPILTVRRVKEHFGSLRRYD